MTSPKDSDLTGENWQPDTGWVDKLWDLQSGLTQEPLPNECEPAKMKDRSTRDGVSNDEESRDNDQATWTEERRQLFKLKNRASIPPAYFGSLFHEDFSEFNIQIFPVTYQDVCESGLGAVVSLATSFRLRLDQQNNLLELCATQDKAKSIMEKILFAKFQHSTVTVKVKRHAPDWGETDDDGNPVYYPALVNKATFKWNSTYAVQFLKGSKPIDNKSGDKERSLFLQNLPEKVSSLILQVLFPLCLKCTVAQVSETTKAAILLMPSSKTAVHHLSSIIDFCLDDRTVLIGTAENSQQEACQQKASGKEGTTEQKQSDSGTSEDAVSKRFGLSGAESTPVQVAADQIFTQKKVGLPGASNSTETTKPKLKLKCPSSIKRDNARRLKYNQKYKILSLPSAPPFPSELMSLCAPGHGGSFTSNNYPCIQKRTTTWQCRPQDGHQQEPDSRSCELPQPPDRRDFDIPLSSNNRDYDLPQPLGRDYDLQWPPDGRGYDFPLPTTRRYELPLPPDNRDLELPLPPDRRDYNLPLPLNCGDYELPRPPTQRDYELPRPSYSRDHELERAVFDRDFEGERVSQDRDYEVERELWIRDHELEQTRRELEYLNRLQEEDAQYYYGY